MANQTISQTDDKASQKEALLDKSLQIDALYDRSNLTKSQLLIWLGQKLSAKKPLYNMVLSFRIKGPINPTYFQNAFQALVDATDALRTIFEEENGVPHQRILDEFPYRVEFIDLSNDPGARKNLKNRLVQRSQNLFDLTKPLFDSALIKVGEDECIWYLNQHHLITDAWSTSLVYRHMAQFYELAVQKQDNATPNLPSYNDFVSFERNKRSSSSHEKALSYWREKTSNQFTPVDFYGKAVSKESLATERVHTDLGKVRTQKLKKMASEKDIRALTADLSIFNVFVTALFAYLYRISGNENIAIGTPSHNRPSAVFKETIGLFIEIFPLQITIEKNETFSSLLQKVKIQSNKFFFYAQPGTSIPESNNSFNVLLNFIHASFPEFNGNPMESEWIHPGYGDRGHSLRLQVHDFDKAGTFLLHFDFNVDVFDGAKRQWAIDHFLRIIDAFIEDKSNRIDDVDLISEDQRQRVLVSYNQTESEIPTNQTVVHLFENQARSLPHAVAILHNGKETTYADLASRSYQLARYLKNQGVQQGDIVGLLMVRSPEFVIAIWGVLKAGAAYVPIDCRYPESRIQFILKDAGCRYVLTLNQSVVPVKDIAITNIDVGKDWPRIARESAEPPPRIQTGLEELAYVIYTSGSTGQPKGVMISHRGLVNYSLWAKRQYLKNDRLDFPLFSSVAFDLTVTSIFVPLIAGGKIVIYDEDHTGGDLSVITVMEDDAVDIVKLTPSHLALVKNLDICPKRIKKFILGGEDLKCDLSRAITEKFGQEIEIYNEYGPTEATVGCMTYLFDIKKNRTGSVPIGDPIANTQIYILDHQLKLVPDGVVGEMCVSGFGIALGYLGRSDLTKEKFVPNPFREGEKLYRTGDLARWNAKGEMEFLGRLDHQVKIKGARIELGEVEKVLASHTQIQECVVDVFSHKVVDESSDDVSFCKRCGIPSNHPHVTGLTNEVCNLCVDFDEYRDKAMNYFRPMDELRDILQKAKAQRKGDYDCIMLLSGGKDSTYVLYQLVEMGLRVLVFSMDNGFISEGAKTNIRRVVQELNLDLIFGHTPAMNSIFVDSLNRFSNVCNGCFKTIYTLSMNLAREKGIRYIVTGLSRGQIFETRLADLFRYRIFDSRTVDQTIIEARKAYHRMDDAVSRSLNVEIFKDDKTFEEIQFIDFYRYCDVQLDEILDFLDTRAPWIRPADTGRSTNCLINELGIYIHKKERGYHNYALPYSWDVRLGHKERDAAMEELDDQINPEHVRGILNEIGYDENRKFKDRVENRLAGYYVAEKPLSAAEIRSHLSTKLPDYMIPSFFVYLTELPLTPNGKVNRKALPLPELRRSDLSEEFTPADTPIEKKLAKIWADVLKIPEAGIHDNFFDLGGDSILNIQIIHRAQREGLNLTPKQLFERPTIAELAEVAQLKPKFAAEQGLISGDVDLTPIQHWFFQQDQPHPHHWNQAMLVEVEFDLDPHLFAEALGALIIHHDVLRLRFRKEPLGWHQFITKTGDGPTIKHVDLSNLSEDEQNKAMEQTGNVLHTSLNIFDGVIFKVACFDLGPTRNNRILFIIHHLAVDGLSWLILFDDIQSAYEQLKKGGKAQLPPKTTSYQQWASFLTNYARSTEIENEWCFWLHQWDAGPISSLPTDFATPGPNTEFSCNTVSTGLSVERTESLLHEVPTAYNTQINDVLLTALAKCVSDWTNSNRMLVTLEGHGREDIFDGVDLTRTVGWFTTLYPVVLVLNDGDELGQDLKKIKEQLRRIPKHGIGWGIRRYLGQDEKIIEALKSKPRPQILFNYLGQIDGLLSGSSIFAAHRELALSRSPESQRSYLLEINAFVFRGKLSVKWTYSKNIHNSSTIGKLADQYIEWLQAIIDHCSSTKNRGFTPSDFPDADLEQQELDDILAEFDESRGSV